MLKIPKLGDRFRREAREKLQIPAYSISSSSVIFLTTNVWHPKNPFWLVYFIYMSSIGMPYVYVYMLVSMAYSPDSPCFQYASYVMNVYVLLSLFICFNPWILHTKYHFSHRSSLIAPVTVHLYDCLTVTHTHICLDNPTLTYFVCRQCLHVLPSSCFLFFLFGVFWLLMYCCYLILP